MLHYEVNVVPKLVFPATFVENIIKEDLPKNLSAIAKRAEIEAEAEASIAVYYTHYRSITTYMVPYSKFYIRYTPKHYYYYANNTLLYITIHNTPHY